MFPVDPCLIVMPPCMGEADRFSLEALRHIHKQLDDDNDGGIEVNESVEVSFAVVYFPFRGSLRWHSVLPEEVWQSRLVKTTPELKRVAFVLKLVLPA